MNRLLIVDGHAYAYRAFHAIRELRSATGQPTNAIYGFVKMLAKMRQRIEPTHLIVVWDGGLSEERVAVLPEYKAQRAPMPETSRLVSSGGEPGRQVKSLVQSSLKGLLIGATPLYLLLLVFAGTLTKIWLRHSFVPAVPSTLRVFLIGTFISLLGMPLYYALIGMGKAAFVFVANAVQLSLGSLGVFWMLHGELAHQGWQVARVLMVADVALAASTTVLALAAARAIRGMKRQATVCMAQAA